MSSQRRRTQRAGRSTQADDSMDVDESQYLSQTFDYSQQTQTGTQNALSIHDQNHYVPIVVKYILAANHANVPITKNNLMKQIGCSNKQFRNVFSIVEVKLKNIFGFEVLNVDNGKFVLYNTIPNRLPHIDFPETIKSHYCLLFLTLLHIFMSGGNVVEDSVYDFYKELRLKRENSSFMHEYFGDMSDLLINVFVKEKYIEKTKSGSDDSPYFELSWGVRAKKELSYRKILEFASKIYGGLGLDAWPQQFDELKKAEAENK